ncbi:MAG: glycosyltransferase family 2 protein [Candidatus Dormibacteria bacterium]
MTRGDAHVTPRESFTVVVMPAFCAEQTLEKTIAFLPREGIDHLLLVDDASPDGTVALAVALGLDVRRHERNAGYGANQKTCYTEALALGATAVVLLHPDFQYDPGSIPALLDPIRAGTADMTFGSRFAGGADPRRGGMPEYRYYGNRIATMIENRLLGTSFTEMHSGMRAYRREVLEALPFRSYSDDFDFDTQFLVGAQLRGLRISEVAIPTRYTVESSSISIPRSVQYVRRSISICYRARRHGVEF